MKFISLGLILFALTLCGLTEMLKQMRSNTSSNTATNTSNSSTTTSSTSASVEKAKPTSAQQARIDGGTETKWDDQGLAWKVPPGWKKTDVKKEQFYYSSPDNAFLIVNISLMPDSFPMDASQKAYFDQALQQLKNGK